MQRDLAGQIAEQLSEKPEQLKQFMDVIKNQTQEIQRRGVKIVDLEDKNEILQKNLNILTTSNKQLECLISSLKEERKKLLEEIEDLKNYKGSELKQKKQKKTVSENIEITK